jgi:hypothetical protein
VALNIVINFVAVLEFPKENPKGSIFSSNPISLHSYNLDLLKKIVRN